MQHTPITYFRSRIVGPEVEIEDAVVQSMKGIFDRTDWPVWLGGSVPIGAGFPDLVSVWYDPEVVTLADFGVEDGHILAYLRSVRSARSTTVAERLRFSLDLVERRIAQLEQSSMINRSNRDAYSIAPTWRRILPEVVTIEAKVSDWRSALQQAIRNSIFAHRSFVAMPHLVASRLKAVDSTGFSMHGIGILSVNEGGEVSMVREARVNTPSVWDYYFHLAAITAKDIFHRSK